MPLRWALVSSFFDGWCCKLSFNRSREYLAFLLSLLFLIRVVLLVPDNHCQRCRFQQMSCPYNFLLLAHADWDDVGIRWSSSSVVENEVSIAPEHWSLCVLLVRAGVVYDPFRAPQSHRHIAMSGWKESTCWCVKSCLSNVWSCFLWDVVGASWSKMKMTVDSFFIIAWWGCWLFDGWC